MTLLTPSADLFVSKRHGLGDRHPGCTRWRGTLTRFCRPLLGKVALHVIVAMVFFLQLLVPGAGAHWDLQWPYTMEAVVGDACVPGVKTKDPINMGFIGERAGIGDTAAHLQEHGLPFTHGNPPWPLRWLEKKQYIWTHGRCQRQSAQRASGSETAPNRYHMRLFRIPGGVDGQYVTLGDAHYERGECGVLNFHATYSFDSGRDVFKYHLNRTGHSALPTQDWRATGRIKQCNGRWVRGDGKVAFFAFRRDSHSHLASASDHDEDDDGPFPPPSGPGEYEVRQCGAGAYQMPQPWPYSQLGWWYNGMGGYGVDDRCAVGVGLAIYHNNTPYQDSQIGMLRMTAPPTTNFVSIYGRGSTLRAWNMPASLKIGGGSTQPNFIWTNFGLGDPCAGQNRSSTFRAGPGVFTWIEFLYDPTGNPAYPRCTGASGMHELQLILYDGEWPTANIDTRNLTGSTWVNGRRTVRISGDDQGSGVAKLSYRIDGGSEQVVRNEPACKRSNGGYWAAPRPCPTNSWYDTEIDTTRLADGAHEIAARSYDASGRMRETGTVRFNVDNQPPSAPERMSVAGGDDEHAQNSFDVAWQNPNQGTLAPISAAWWRLSHSEPLNLTNRPAYDGQAAFSPDGTRVAFATERDGDSEIYVMDADGSNRRRLTDNRASDYGPVFSPDGTKIAFASLRTGDREIFVMDTDGSGERNATGSPGSDETQPAWQRVPASDPAENGKIAFASNRDGNWEIYSANPDGSEQVNLTNAAGLDKGPAWSVDGEKLAFYTSRDGNYEIYKSDPAGEELQRLTTSSSTETNPTWASDGSRIAFESSRSGNQDIYTKAADTSTSWTQVTRRAADESEPSWSPTDPLIAFESSRSGNFEVHTTFAKGEGPANLTEDAAQDASPRWSPDGSKVVFASNRSGNFNVYRMNADGTGLRRITDDPADDYAPTWSPDGRRIAFTTDRTGSREIYTMTINGSQEQNQSRAPTSDEVYPSWQRGPGDTNGRLAFSSNRDRNWEIYSMAQDGTDQRRLTNSPTTDGAASWSRDGTKIAFHSDRTGNYEVFVMNADGSGVRNVTSNPAMDLFPAWSPSGTMLVFQSNRSGNADAFVAEADGSNPTNVTATAGDDVEPAWSPDGTRLVVQSNRAGGNYEIYSLPASTPWRRRAGATPELRQIAVPGPGRWTLEVVLEDAAGNRAPFGCSCRSIGEKLLIYRPN